MSKHVFLPPTRAHYFTLPPYILQTEYRGVFKQKLMGDGKLATRFQGCGLAH
jgi:hypothetical protein